MLDVISTELSGLTLQEITRRLTSDQFTKELKTIHGSEYRRPCDLMVGLGLRSRYLSELVCRENQAKFDPSHPSSESRVLDREASAASERVAVAVSLLAILYSKWAGLKTEVSKIVSSQAGGELHAELVLPYVGEWFSANLTWQQAIEPIVSGLILDQHDRVMYEKGKLESCWLHRREGRVVKDQDYSPNYRSPRSENSIWILKDLGLLAVSTNKELTVTARGNTLMRKALG